MTRNPFAKSRDRKSRTRVIPSKKTYKRRDKHPKDEKLSVDK